MRILLIEDDMVLGAAVRDQIAADGHLVDWVQRLDAAGDAMAGASYDLVLLDLNMPGMDGVETLAAIRAMGGRNARVPVVAMTADATVAALPQMDGILVKPIDPEQLLAGLARHLPAT